MSRGTDHPLLEPLRVARRTIDETPSHVAAARRANLSWAAIGRALGITAQGAQQRYGEHARVAAGQFLPGDPEVRVLNGHGYNGPITRPTVLVWDNSRLRDRWLVEAVMPASWDPGYAMDACVHVDQESHAYRTSWNRERPNKGGGIGAYVPQPPDAVEVDAAIERMTHALRHAQRPSEREAALREDQ